MASLTSLAGKAQKDGADYYKALGADIKKTLGMGPRIKAGAGYKF
jgi:hypothetical protein